MNILEELKGLRAAMSNIDWEDPEAVVQIIGRVENVTKGVTDATVCGSLDTVLAALRSVCTAETPDGREATSAAVGVVGALASLLAGGETEKYLADLKHSLATVRNVLELGSREPTESASVADWSLDDLAARLVCLSPDDREGLTSLCEQLEACSADETLADDVQESLRFAAAFVEQAINGNTDDPGAALASAGDSIAEALSAAENTRDAGPSAEPAELDTAPAAPAEDAEVSVVTTESVEPTEAAGSAVLPADADAEILVEYIVESIDHISAAEESLLALESNPDDMEQVNTVFRAFHTIKGTSGFFGLDAHQRLAHLAENLLVRARDGEIKLVGGFADLCLRSCDLLKTMVEDLDGLHPGDALSLPQGLDDLLNALSDPEGSGASEEAEVDSMRVGDILVGKGVVERPEMETAADLQGSARIGETLVQHGVAPVTEVAKALRHQKKGATTEATVRVATERMDNLINMVGELVIAQSMVAQDPDIADGRNPRLLRNVTHAGKIIRELQDDTMSLRMVPLNRDFPDRLLPTTTVGLPGRHITFSFNVKHVRCFGKAHWPVIWP